MVFRNFKNMQIGNAGNGKPEVFTFVPTQQKG